MRTGKNRDIRLKSRPVGLPTPDNFELVEGEIPHPGPGQILVRNLFMSVDPYMRGRMMDRKSYVPPFQIGEVLQGGAVGVVVTSNGNGQFQEGDHVLGMDGWREWFVSSGAGLQKVDPKLAPAQAYLGALGMPGLTAYAGLLRIGELKKSDRVFVSAASGAVGAIVCQIARNKGCEIVVGSAGSDEKCAYLKELGCTAAINYRTCGDLGAALADAMPGGIDVYFDNVGGSHLTAALNNMNTFGHIVACGMIEIYNATEAPKGPPNLANIVGQSLTMRGFIVLNHIDMLPAFQRDMGAWIAEGKMTWRETIIDGIERAPEALIGLFKGDNFGKMLVKLSDG
ncbi:MAG: NADP-dependent oxidoreductase [Alphaproteobacteria bacterium]|nr:NADP-dependent oxidoreductase [Alphaproteobacteria bacterium]